MQQLRAKTIQYSLIFPPPSIARYSFIQLSELGRRVEKENAQASKQYQRGFALGVSRLRVRHSTDVSNIFAIHIKILHNKVGDNELPVHMRSTPIPLPSSSSNPRNSEVSHTRYLCRCAIGDMKKLRKAASERMSSIQGKLSM